MSIFKKICNDYGLNENQLSKLTGINTSTMSTTKKSKNKDTVKKMSAENLRRLAKGLGASMDEIYDWYGEDE